MEWLSQNWIFIIILVAFAAMHLFGHGRHGGSYREGRAGDRSRPSQRQGHQH